MNQQTQPARRRRWPIILAAIGATLIAIIAISVATSSNQTTNPTNPIGPVTSSPLPRTTQGDEQATQNEQQSEPKTVTFEVRGTAPDGVQITYGTDSENHDLAGTLPAKASMRYDTHALYYHLTAQLQGSGSIKIRILLDGREVAHGAASGGYNIAMAQYMVS